MKHFNRSYIACLYGCALFVSACDAQPQDLSPGDPQSTGVEPPGTPETIVADHLDQPGLDLQRLDLASLLGSGAISAGHNAGWNNFPRKITDGDTGTFKTTNGADPVRLTFTFQRPTVVKAARLFLSGAPEYDWTLRAGNNGPAFGIQGAGPDRWSRIDLPEPMTIQSLVMELKRPGTDHTLSVHEVELYGPP